MFKYAPPHITWTPQLSAQYKVDLAQACYSEQEISVLSANWANLCARCLQWGHRKQTCQARLICFNCSAPDHKAIYFPLKKQLPTIGVQSLGNERRKSGTAIGVQIPGNERRKSGTANSHFPSKNTFHSRPHAATTV